MRNRLKIRFRRPVVFVREEQYELTLRLPEGASVSPGSAPTGFRIKEFDASYKKLLVQLYNRSGFSFTDDRLEEALKMCLPGGVFLVEHSESGELVSTMMARHLSSTEFPFGGLIDWLASDPGFRGRGLGRLSAALATNHLIKLGYKNIWVTTHPHRVDAIRIFVSLGFVPTDRSLREYAWGEIQKATAAGSRERTASEDGLWGE